MNLQPNPSHNSHPIPEQKIVRLIQVGSKISIFICDFFLTGKVIFNFNFFIQECDLVKFDLDWGY